MRVHLTKHQRNRINRERRRDTLKWLRFLTHHVFNHHIN